MTDLKYKPHNLNTAQKLYANLGVDILRMFGHMTEKQRSFTKKGPGRRHQQGKKKD